MEMVYCQDLAFLKQNSCHFALIKQNQQLFLVPPTGIEPVLCCQNGILSPGRLPVPPRRQSWSIHYSEDILQNSSLALYHFSIRKSTPIHCRQRLSRYLKNIIQKNLQKIKTATLPLLTLYRFYDILKNGVNFGGLPKWS